MIPVIIKKEPKSEPPIFVNNPRKFVKRSSNEWRQIGKFGHVIHQTIMVCVCCFRFRSDSRIVFTCFCECVPVPGGNLEIANFLRGHIDNEVNLNSDGSCVSNCVDYQNTKQYKFRPGTLCGEAPANQRRKFVCQGRIRGCHTMDDELSICQSVSKDE